MRSAKVAVLTAVVGSAASAVATPVNVTKFNGPPSSPSTLIPIKYTFSNCPGNLPEGCGVQINVVSKGNSSDLDWLILPYNWYGRLLYLLVLYHSSAAVASSISWVDMGIVTHYGFVTLSSNLGHIGIDTAGTWASGQPEAVVDLATGSPNKILSLG
ncbi:uncharacterized protein BO95DRAFT_469183 [Aspergillus brunneoviolaceus CBS 621.78]|uniref:Uncharacterized protein n=1 Tax=Aspergillus brunneoviolaceus CBS 621.78 TaxID=1450534 RepID=A0ACD1FSP8_9EURO|nr:hypothetical protein BO95DRAFT_469183 [Aspergillus brunneoviolaceus CBS 621.78]RAH40033.1 hypothetical protein BO95DRAFT_469183 [Aspergillus brunneoviolaceus CBS 621.78]